MKLWLISQNENHNYDTFDSAVVAAETELEAQQICPSEYYVSGQDGMFHFQYNNGRLGEASNCNSWCNWHQVKVEYLGETDCKAGVICASFNAG